MTSCDNCSFVTSYLSSDTSSSSESMSNYTPKKATSASSSLFSTTELMQKDLKRGFDVPTYDKVTVAEFPAARGILNDFDMAAVLNPDSGFDPASSPHHHLTGTLPFMAVDLLEPSRSDSSNIHHYRHDLESFYYFLIWATTLYDLKADHRVAPKERSRLYQWSKGDEISAYHAKVSLHSRDFEKYAADVRTELKNVWDTWVVPLSNLFIDGMQAQTNAARRKVDSFDHATCDGHITFEKFMSAIGETAHGLANKPQL